MTGGAKKKPASILVIQTAFLGDIVLTSGFLRELRKLCPDSRITLLTTPIGAEVLQPNSWNIDFLVYDKKGKQRGFSALMQKLAEVRARKPDLVFCLHRSVRSGVIARWSGAKEIWGFKEAAARLFYTHKVSRKDSVYEAEKNRRMLEKYFQCSGAEISPYPELFCTDEEKAIAHGLVGDVEYVVIAPSSVWATKRWPADRFGTLAAKIEKDFGLPLVIVSGADREDRNVVNALEQSYIASGGATSMLVNLAGKTSLGVLKAVLARAKFVICNDSAPLHLAIAVGRPGLAIFGPTVKSQGFFPFVADNTWSVVENKGLDCRPCGEHGHQRCPKTHFRCMLDLPVSMVFDRVKSLCQPN